MNTLEVYVMDVGNTALKIAVFQNATMKTVYRINQEDCLKLDWSNKLIVLSNVASKEFSSALQKKGGKIIEITSGFSASFTSAYNSMNTLGVDRFCNVEAMAISGQKGNLLCIDIGTCVKFDLLDKQKVYCGGSISPGLDLRFKSLNDYTARLPLLEKKSFRSLNGKSTDESILSGVILGLEAEIYKRMDWYEAEYDDLTIFVTGGDASYFDFHQKSNIFADENLTLKGIYSIFCNHAQ
ncbi:MAG: type III pantothenate kinase [Crocinitomicaceae bacterium]